MSAILATVPIFMIILLGYSLRKWNVIKQPWTKVLSSFVYYVSLPALIIYSFTTVSWSENGILSLVGYNLLFIVLAAFVVVAILAFLPFKRKTEAVILLAATVGNTVYLGVPLTDSAITGTINSDINGLITTIGVVQLVGGLTIALILFEFYYFGTKKVGFIFKQIIRNPIVVSALVGIVISLAGGWPSWLDQIALTPLKMIAVTASPIALLALGSFLAGHKFKKPRYEQLTVVVILKMAILPLIAWGFMYFTNQPTVYTDITILMAAMPVAVTAFVIAEMYNLDVQFAAMTLLVTTVVSIGSVTLLAAVL